MPVNCVITSLEQRLITGADGTNPKQRDGSPTNATFKIKDTKLYVPVVTFSEQFFLEQLKTGFKRTIKWNRYKSEMSNQVRNNSLNYLLDPTFTNVNRLFVLSFKNDENDDDENERVRTSFKKIYVPKVEKTLMY